MPIRGGVERALGVLVVHDAEPRDYTAADVLYLRALANILAATIARERAQATLTCLQETTARLTEARTSREIGEAMVSSGATCVEAAGGWVAEVSADGSSLEMLASLGYEESRAADYRSISLDTRNPTTDAISRKTALYFRTAAEFRAEYPDVPYTRFEAMAVMPVITAAGAVGVLALNFDEPRSFDHAERALLDVLAKLFSQSLERARLYEDARRREWSASLVARLSESLEQATSPFPERCRQGRRHSLATEPRRFPPEAVDLSRRRRGASAHCSSSRRGAPVQTRVTWRTSLQPMRLLDTKAHPRAQERGHRPGRTERRVQLHALPLRARRSGSPACSSSPTDFGRPGALCSALRMAASSSPDHVACSRSTTPASSRRTSRARPRAPFSSAFSGGELPGAGQGSGLTSAYRPGHGHERGVAAATGTTRFEVGHGRLAILVGDVVGHDLDAAVAMGQLRGCGPWRSSQQLGGPAELLERLDSFVSRPPQGWASMTTMAYAELDVASGALRYACAGHPPPLAISAAGEPRLLWGGRSGPLGADIRSRLDESERLEPGGTLVLYTDGLRSSARAKALAVGLDPPAGRGAQTRTPERRRLRSSTSSSRRCSRDIRRRTTCVRSPAARSDGRDARPAVEAPSLDAGMTRGMRQERNGGHQRGARAGARARSSCSRRRASEPALRSRTALGDRGRGRCGGFSGRRNGTSRPCRGSTGSRTPRTTRPRRRREAGPRVESLVRSLRTDVRLDRPSDVDPGVRPSPTRCGSSIRTGSSS